MLAACLSNGIFTHNGCAAGVGCDPDGWKTWYKTHHTTNHHTTIFFIKFWRTHVLFWGHWYPCFEFLVTSPLGFKARVGSALFAYCGGECNVHSSRSTSGATLADLLAASAQPVLSPHTVAEVRLPGLELVLSEYLWARRSTNWAKPGPAYHTTIQHRHVYSLGEFWGWGLLSLTEFQSIDKQQTRSKTPPLLSGIEARAPAAESGAETLPGETRDVGKRLRAAAESQQTAADEAGGAGARKRQPQDVSPGQQTTTGNCNNSRINHYGSFTPNQNSNPLASDSRIGVNWTMHS